MRWLLVPLLAAALVLAVAGGAIGQKPPEILSLHSELDAIVRFYRQIIVLMSDRQTLAAQDREDAFAIGKILYEEGIPAREALADRLAQAIQSAMNKDEQKQLPPLLLEFLDRLEKDPDWHDADKLAFQEIVDSLIENIRGITTQPSFLKPLLQRIHEDRTALSQIQQLYDRELDAIFGQFATRGMEVRREAWESYVSFLKTLFSAKGVLDEYRHRIRPSTQKPAKPAAKPAGMPRLPDKTVVFTFDDGPHRRYTPRVKEILHRFQAKGVFFQVGANIGTLGKDGTLKESKAAPEARALPQAGHLLANHTYTHPFLPKLDAEHQASELDLTEKMITHVQEAKPGLFRPPYGAYDEVLLSGLTARGMHMMLWDIDSQDWADPVPKSIANRVISEARQKGRGVILLHDIHGRTVEALPLILETLEDDGFSFALWNGRELLAAAPRRPSTPKAASETAPLYRESFAVLIGINEYKKWPRLTYATADALAMKELLIKTFHFKPENVTLLLDAEATRERIVAELADALGNPERVKKEDRVLVFFAGHGATRKLPSGKTLGYIVPVEADTQNLHSQCISMTHFQDFSESIPAKHLFYIMDACYGGLGLTRGTGVAAPGSAKYLREVTRRTARQMLTAGGPEEQVADNGPNGHSIFTWTLIEGLRGKADLNSDNVVTASELFAFVGPGVSSVSRQTPAFGSLVGSEGGEFILELAPNPEFLSDLTAQLDDESIRLNRQIEAARKEIAAKRSRNEELRKELAATRAELQKAGGKPESVSEPVLARKKSDEGLALYRERKYEEALKILQESFALQPSNAQTANNIGYVFYRMGKHEEAIQWYERTLALDPQRAVAWLNIANAWESLGEPAKALDAYRRFLELAPNHASAESALQRIQALSANPEER